MNPIKAVVRAMERRAGRTALGRRFLSRLGRSPAAFGVILEGAANKEASLTRIIDHKTAIARMMVSPKIFEKILVSVSHNPEILFRLLSQGGLRKRMRAQKGFLQSIAKDPETLKHVLSGVPRENLGAVVADLLRKENTTLHESHETKDLVAGETQNSEVYPEISECGHAQHKEWVVNTIVSLMHDNVPEVIAEVVARNPQLFHSGSMRQLAVRSAGTDIGSLSDMVSLFAVLPTNGGTPGERLDSLMQTIFSQPVVMQAMIQDTNLQKTLLVALEDSAAAAGIKVDDIRDKPREKTKETT